MIVRALEGALYGERTSPFRRHGTLRFPGDACSHIRAESFQSNDQASPHAYHHSRTRSRVSSPLLPPAAFLRPPAPAPIASASTMPTPPHLLTLTSLAAAAVMALSLLPPRLAADRFLQRRHLASAARLPTPRAQPHASAGTAGRVRDASLARAWFRGRTVLLQGA